MEEYTQITLDEWTRWKEDIRQKLAETAGNFVYIGCRLKQIRDSGMYGGAADVFEFARNEYGLGKSTVSRFIAINEKYSEGGNSLELKEEFRGFSSSKLAEMLTLPDSEIQLITEKTTIREIRELKSFDSEAPMQEEREKEPEENAVPAQSRLGEAGFVATSQQEPEAERTPLEKCLIDYFKDKKEMLDSIMAHLAAEPVEYKQAAERMAPSGQASHRKGLVFLFLYDWNRGIKYKLMTRPEPVSMTWAELLDMIFRIFGVCEGPDVWRSFYGGQEEPAEEFPKETPQEPIKEPAEEPKEEPKREPEEKPAGKPEEKAVPAQSRLGEDGSVATSQQEPETEPMETASMEEPVPESPEPAAEEIQAEGSRKEASGEEEEERLPGQDCVTDHPEYLSREMQQKEAEKLSRRIRLAFWDWTGKEMPKEELKTAKADTEKLLALIDRMLEEKEEP